MQPVNENRALTAFLKDCGARFETLADPAILRKLPKLYRLAGRTVNSYAKGFWQSNHSRVSPGFRVNTARRTIEINKDSFRSICGYVCNFIFGLQDVEIRSIIDALGSRQTQISAIMSGFFYYFFTHELIHIEQGLGSDQYVDSDFYLPIVMEADYEADISGLVVAAHAAIAEFASLDLRQRTLLLIAIHIASMHGFTRSAAGGRISSEAFSRIALWYLHYSRFAKARAQPRFTDQSHYRSWIIMFPRLIGRTDHEVSIAALNRRHETPYAAGSDIIVAYHGANRLYHIHRAAMTDSDRTLRLCSAIIHESFDSVREEFEELLISNPTLSSDQLGPTQERMERYVISAIAVLEQLSKADLSDGGALDLERIAVDVEESLISIRRNADSGETDVIELCLIGEEASGHLRANLKESRMEPASHAAIRRSTRQLLAILAQLADLT